MAGVRGQYADYSEFFTPILTFPRQGGRNIKWILSILQLAE
ncbi:MAG: hypothetical protein V2A69_13465 [Pseudomonadota bacterium]